MKGIRLNAKYRNKVTPELVEPDLTENKEKTLVDIFIELLKKVIEYLKSLSN